MKTIEEKAKAYDEALERANNFIENGDEYEKTVAESIFAGLRESEDERIRKKLIGIFTNQSLCDVYNLKSEDVIAYLERQKELLTPEEKMKHPLYVEGFEAGKQVGTQYEAVFGKQKEQKPTEVERNPIVRMLKDKKAITEDIRNGIPTKTIEKERNVKFATPVDVSHTEWSDKDKNIFNLALDLIKHSDDCDGILDKELAVKWFAELPSRFAPQPKQEWSEEDEKTRDWLIQQFDGMLPNKNGFYYLKARPWLAELPNRFALKPKSEWSEEDKTMINHIIEALPRWVNGQITILPSQAEEYVKRLKSLRSQPKPEWSEGTKNRLLELVEYLKYKGREDDAEFLETLLIKK